MSDWFEEWFGEEYLALYPHRDEQEARTVAELIASCVDVPAGALALDLACGAGRHARALAERWSVVGLDLSPTLLQRARAAEPALSLVRGDMRCLPFRSGAFALVVNLFTSFGYFREDAQHARVLREVARAMAPGGWFVLDYLNAPQVRASLVPHDARRVGARVVEQERSISADGRFVYKTILLWDEGRMFTERVRLFEPAELGDMLTACGFEVATVLGDYAGRPHTRESPRALFVARRA